MAMIRARCCKMLHGQEQRLGRARSQGVPVKSKRPRRLRRGQLPTENPQSQGYCSALVVRRQSSLWPLSRHQSRCNVAMTLYQLTPSARRMAWFRRRIDDFLCSPTVSSREGAVVMTFTLPGRTPGERQGNARETLGKAPTEILRLLKDQPDLSVSQLAALMDKSESAIHRAIRILRDSGLLVRVGSAKGGHWKVIG